MDSCTPQLLPGPREPRLARRPRFPGKGARKSPTENFPNSQPLGIGAHHRESGKCFTKQQRHMSDGCGLRNPHTDPCGRLRKVSCVAAGALGIRGDSQSPGDCNEDAGQVPGVARNGLQPWGLPSPGRPDVSVPGAEWSGSCRGGALGTERNVPQHCRRGSAA